MSPDLHSAMRDHPRSRGVYPGHRRSPCPGSGSSPLARGLQAAAGSFRDDARIIPARAGFTPVAGRCGRLPGDHPRSRGVYPRALRGRATTTGSSPLARGLQWIRNPGGPARRIIPARAGFTECPTSHGRGLRDHPRSRGVYATMRMRPSSMLGSSPLARGLHHQGPLRTPHRRIIPARAGFTHALGGAAMTAGDHPRSRGVYFSRRHRRGTRNGSSPLARGLPFVSFPIAHSPADHPRSRGVYDRGRAMKWLVDGSSPLARGLPTRTR